jgi:hypothetical protein
MKLNRVIISLVPCLALVLTAQAATPSTNIWDFTFSVRAITNTPPDAPPVGNSITPDGGNPRAIIFGNNNTYFFGTGPNGLYGSPTGLWDVEGAAGGHVQITSDLVTPFPVTYTLKIWQFADDGRSFYPGTLSLSPSGAQFVSESVYVPQSGNMFGAWYLDTYSWSSFIPSTTISVDINPGPGSGALLFDEVQLTAVLNAPEPSSCLIGAAGLLLFGIRSWLRRKV